MFEPFNQFQDTTIQDVFDLIVQAFNLYPLSFLAFSYKNYQPNNNNSTTTTKTNYKWIRLNHYKQNKLLLQNHTITTSNGTTRPLTFNDLVLHKNILPGKILYRDFSCDSVYIISVVCDIGQAIRNSFHFAPAHVPIYLIMDNAGGHGTIQAKSDFVSILQKEYNVIVDWQVANSPESNMLDLGAWMLMQSCVEMLHNNKVMEENVLTSGIRNAIFHLD